MLSESPDQKLPSDCRPEPPGSVLRWKLWLTTVQCWSRTAQRKASIPDVFAEYRSQSGACPCGRLASVFFTIAEVSRAWLLTEGVAVNRPANVRLVVTLGPSSQTATRIPVPSNPAW